jgi:tetratricopeptide (TPR) repeat protein/2-polyprenyl-3-methyl-5-hydroxy-6-metoxy-1,4-benzoquinol methylase
MAGHVMRRATPEIQSILGDAVRYHQAGRLDEAIARYRQALVLDPEYVGVHNNLGSALFEQGKLEEAEASYRRALKFGPGDAEAHSNLGTVFYQQGKLGQAVASYGEALALQPDHAEAHANLGTALFSLGQVEDALACYRRALAFKPDFVAARTYLGTVLWELGKLDEAQAEYRRALKIDPHYTNALDRLAAVLMIEGNDAMALDTIWRSLQITETQKNKKLFVDIVKKTRWTRDDGKIRLAVSRALTEPWARPSELAQVGADLIKCNLDIGACVTRAAQAWPQVLSTQELFGSLDLAVLSADPLLCGLLTSTQNTDIALERFLTMARRLMLEAAAGMPAQGYETDDAAAAALPFYSALARQCFINEYVFSHTDHEIRQAADLRDTLANALAAQTPVPALWVIAVAAYFPLSSLPYSGRLLALQWAAPVADILAEQIAEPQEEKQLRATMARATPIKDAVSRLVRDQYEENPYPRWVRMPPTEGANTITEYLRKKFPFAPFAPFARRSSGGRAELLSAGCGTGQLAIEIAMGIKARLLAVDLSLASLGYAKRKTRELGLTSIEYAQADLLELGAPEFGTTGRQFDAVECSGVLHHMADPFAGWLVLLSLLRPGGFMLVGLYSQVARRDIVRTRRLIAERSFGPGADEIRRCRQDLLDLAERENLATATSSSDFFGMSSCRDLLFHSQEVEMTLGGIASFLRGNGVTFLGFEIEGSVLQAYRKKFPDDPAATDLTHWQAFELDNPGTFVGMYIFWVQKQV